MDADEPRQWFVAKHGAGPAVPWRTGRELPREWTSRVDAEHLPFTVALDMRTDAHGPACIAVRMEVKPGGPLAVGARHLREVPLAECIAIAVADAVVSPQTTADPDFAGSLAAARSIRPRAANTSDQHLRRVAGVYMNAAEKPARAVEAAFAPVSYSTATRWIGEARRRGFLPPVKTRKDRS